jgi:hypothetical protein
MYPTAEVRWFQTGFIPREVKEWFESRPGQAEDQPPRRDHYLDLAGDETRSIKLRQGRLEVKQRHQQSGSVRFEERVAGVVERWHKWGFALSEMAAVTGDLPGRDSMDASWIAVDKDRSLYRFRLSGEEQGREVAVPVPPGVYPVQGCELELCQIHAGGQVWWSLCFEAFGQESTLEANLLSAARQILFKGSPLVLNAADSYGYPRWLGLLRKGN